MNFGMQLKLRKDAFNGHFTNGLTMAGGESVQRCKKICLDESTTLFDAEQYNVFAHHIDKGDVVECFTVFENKSEEELTLDMISSFCIENINADIIHRATSFWSAEGKLLSQNLVDINMEPSWSGHGTRVEKFGQIGSMPVRKWFPFVVLENSQTKEFVGVQLYCPASWQIELFRNNEPLTLAGGIADFDFGHWSKIIKSGEKFTTPKAVVAFGNSLYDVCDKLVKAQMPDIADADKDMPVVFNEYCTTWGNPTIENIERIAKRISKSGIKYLVIDSGWYKDSNDDWWATIGDWNANKKLFPNGIKEVSDLIKSYGLIPGIWFEFEKVAWLSDLYKQTDHLLKRDGVPISVDGQRFLDMSDDWCTEYLTNKVIDFLRDNGFGYIKIDYNDTIGVGCDGAESLGEGLYRTVAGTQKFFKKMRAQLPDLVIEGCSSGGHRLEPSFMELISQASFSDAHECKSIPLIAANLHRLIRPEQSQIWAVLRADDDIHRINYSLCAGFLGRLCLSGEIFDVSDENWLNVKQAIDFYSCIKDVIKHGKTTLIETQAKDYTNPQGYQIVFREYGKKALMVVHTFCNSGNLELEEYLQDWKIEQTFGSELDSDYRAKAFLLRQ